MFDQIYLVIHVTVHDAKVVRYQPESYWPKCAFKIGEASMGYRTKDYGSEFLVLPNG